MKKNFILLILCLASLLFGPISACKKDTESNNYLKGKIDGVPFESTSEIWATPGQSGDKIIAFTGDWSPNSIRFYLDGQGSDITTGSYNFRTGDLYNAGLYLDNWGYSSGYFYSFASPCVFYGSGKITILEISKKRIKGNFEFVAVNGAGDSKTVSDGEFYIKR